MEGVPRGSQEEGPVGVPLKASSRGPLEGVPWKLSHGRVPLRGLVIGVPCRGPLKESS
jgi:hypothetical protein